MNVGVLNPGSMTFWSSNTKFDEYGTPLTLSPKEYMILMRPKCLSYNFKKWLFIKKINTSKFRSIIRKAKQNQDGKI